MLRVMFSCVYSQVMIPLPLSPVVVYLQFTIPLYFLFAVFYDGFTTVYDTIYGNIPLPWEHKHVIGNTVLVSTEDFHSRYLNSTNLPSTGN